MPSVPLDLNLEALLEPIPGPDPAGPVPYAERAELEEARKEKEDPDAQEPGILLRPDWSKIARQAQDILRGKSKDLSVATRLTEALFRQHSFAALPECFRLLRRLVAECWDRIVPPLDEDGTAEARASAVSWLCNAQRGAFFPSAIRLSPLFRSGDRSYGLLDWQNAQDPKKRWSDSDKEDLEKAIKDLRLEECERLAGDLARALDEVGKLSLVLQEKMAAEAPNTDELRKALNECLQLIRQVLSRKRPVATTPAAKPASAAGNGKTDGPAAAPAPAATRAEAYQQLAQAAALLRELEPHSPIPYLIQRAVALGAKPFPELIRELIREPNLLAELSREFGLSEEKKPSES
jgi:type VI secretion system protein ImpA